MFFLKKRKLSYLLGHLAEFLVVFYLKLSFCTILHRRYKLSFGEIDIIAKRGNSIFFVEVKFRNDGRDILYSLSQRQLSRIKKVAEHFLIYHDNDYNLYFDAYFISLNRFPIKISNILT